MARAGPVGALEKRAYRSVNENMTLQQQVRDFFAINGARPKKQLGQHFLTNADVLTLILEAGEVADTDTVIEIGAGLGCLTAALAGQAKRVIAVEVDALLSAALEAQFSANPCIRLVHADILKSDFGALLEADSRPKVIANLPYHITTPILWKLLAHHEQLDSCVLMLQKEVAERIVAAPGGKDYGALTIGVSYYAEATFIALLSPDNFYPPPKVESALLKLTMRDAPPVAVDDEELFFQIVRTAFRMRRKMLKNALARGKFASADALNSAFETVDIAPQRRAETLDIAEFAALANQLAR